MYYEPAKKITVSILFFVSIPNLVLIILISDIQIPEVLSFHLGFEFTIFKKSNLKSVENVSDLSGFPSKNTFLKKYQNIYN